MQGFAHHEARTGFLEGEMALPRHDAYTIEFTITKRNPWLMTWATRRSRCTIRRDSVHQLRNLQEVDRAPRM